MVSRLVSTWIDDRDLRSVSDVGHEIGQIGPLGDVLPIVLTSAG